MREAAIAAAVLLGACYPTTTRPALVPVPEAITVEVELSVPEATRLLAVALDSDSIPVARTEPEDGWLTTDWFDVETRRPTRSRRLGPDVVLVRGFVDPGRPNHAVITVEVVHRPLADPSREGRALEAHVPGEHPVADQVRRIVTALGGG